MLGRITSAVVIVVLTGATATYAGQKTPNGRPFQQMQAQIAELQQQMQAQMTAMQRALTEQIQALQTRIDTVENNLQTQIDAINTSFATLRDQVVSAADGVAALQERVAAGEKAIAALQSSVATLRAEADAVDASITGLQATLAELETNTAANSNDIVTLQQQSVGLHQKAVTLATLISMHETQIAALRSEDDRIARFLGNMVDATCDSGAAIADIAEGGLVVCSKQTGGLQSTYTTVVAGTMGFNGLTTVNLACNAGYAAMSGGYYRATVNETLQYVSNLSVTQVFQPFYTPSGTKTLFTGNVVTPTWSYLPRDPVTVLSSRTEPGAYHVEFMYSPQSSTARPYYEASVTCVRVQQ